MTTYWNSEADITELVMPTYGFNPVTNALSSDWTWTRGTTPADIRKHPTDGIPYVPAWYAGMNDPIGYYSVNGVSSENLRASCLLRMLGKIGDPTNRQRCTMYVYAKKSTGYVLYLQAELNRYPDETSEWVKVSGPISSSTKRMNIVENVWYRIGLEKIGRTVNLYLSDAYSTLLNVAPQVGSMTLKCSTVIPPEYESPTWESYWGISLEAASLSNLEYSGFHDPRIESISVTPQVSGGATSPLPIRPSPFYSFPSVSTGNPYGSPFDEAGLSDYHKYKSLRAASDIYNHLKLR